MTNSASMSTYTTMMRVNSKGRPYAKDMFDLFSALLIQLPLSDHRSLFRTYPGTFTTDEAVENLGHLEFTHLVSTPNPIDPSSPIVTRTTTTFSMSRLMAKTLGQHLINARLAENATDPQNRTMKERGIWAPTPKGKFVIQDFSHRARVSIKHMQVALSRIPSFPIIMLERLLHDDQISFSRPNILDAFRSMMDYLPTDSIMIDDIGGISNENMNQFEKCFYGYQCFEWISEYTSVVSKEEAEMVAAEFVQYGWISQVLDKSDRDSGKKDNMVLFKTGKKSLYYLTEKGRQIIEAPTIPFNISNPVGIPKSNASKRSRRHSSETSNSTSSRDSITTSSYNQPQNDFKVAKEEHMSRLLPTTATISLEESTKFIPKAIITKQKTHIEDSQSISSKELKPIEIDNKCDFGFSSTSSSSSTDSDTVFSSSPNPENPTYILSKFEDSIHNEDMKEIEEKVESLNILSNRHKYTNSETKSLLSTMSNKLEVQVNSQDSRLQNILDDPLIRMYFRRFLKSCFCEENINFWVDYIALIKKLSIVVDDETILPTQDQVTDSLCDNLLTHCCTIYVNYFCPDNAQNELNIDHGLRYDIIQYMKSSFTTQVLLGESDSSNKDFSNSQKRYAAADSANIPFGSISVSSHGILSSSVATSFRKKKRGYGGGRSLVLKKDLTETPQACLFHIIQLYDLVNRHICRIMAEDSVPRFMKTTKYKELMKSYYQSSHNN